MQQRRLKVFYSYAHEDRDLCERLKRFLTPLRHTNVIADWYDRDISAGEEWEKQIDDHLNSADLIVLLVSADFIASDYCWGVEVKRAMERHGKGEARVVPVILRPCHWDDAPFSKLQCLPAEARPVTKWANMDDAFLDVTKGIRRAIDQLREIEEQKRKAEEQCQAAEGYRAEERRRTEEKRYPPEEETKSEVSARPVKSSSSIPRWLVALIVVGILGVIVYVVIDGNERLFRPVLPKIQDLHGGSTEQVQSLQKQTAQALGKFVEFRDKLQDGNDGPIMVVIPAGKFQMGSPESEEGRYDNEKQHPVEIERPFAIGKYEVTFAEYDKFAEATGREKPNDRGWGRGRRPVIHVSWHDAVAYAEWLSEQTGEKYRLPTEAEWEYSARAGTVTPFWFGESISSEQANYGFNKVQIVPVDEFAPNSWGLYNVHGNVWEWTCSEYDKNYGGAERLCKSKNNANTYWVLRGSSWRSVPLRLRAAKRGYGPPGDADNILGFRLARSLTF